MRKKFSSSWRASKQPRKQRKYIANAPLHLKRKMLNSNLSKELRKKYGKRSMPVKKGDIVKIMRGKFKKKKGKILSVDIKLQRVEVEGIQVKKQDGSKINLGLQPSNLQIVELNMEDRKRNKRGNIVKNGKRQNKKTEMEKEEKIKETRPSVAELREVKNNAS